MKYIINEFIIYISFRLDDLFLNAAVFYMKDTIPVESSLENLFDFFNSIQHFYSELLRKSIIVQNHCNPSRFSRPLYYNYLLVDGGILKPILEKYTTLDLRENAILAEDHTDFRGGCFYAGKGKCGRKFKHLFNVKKSNTVLSKRKPSKKCKRIRETWENGHGVAVIQLFPECCEYEALSREFAIIKGLGLGNITNAINSTCYGMMKDTWNMNEIVNFGNMLVYRALKMSIQDPPIMIYEQDLE